MGYPVWDPSVPRGQKPPVTRRVPDGKTHTARYPYGPRVILKLSGTQPGTVRGGLSHLGPVCIPPTKTAGYPPGIPHGPRDVCHTGTEREPSGCFGWEESKIGGRVRLDRLGDLQRTCPNSIEALTRFILINNIHSKCNFCVIMNSP